MSEMATDDVVQADGTSEVEAQGEANRHEPSLPTRDSVVTLREVTKDSVYKICCLKTTKEQESFVAPNAISFAQALFEPHAWFRAIYADETPVGFVMLYDDPEHQDGEVTRPEYYLWRFMVDERYQGMGFGRKALDLVVAHVRTRPNATAMTLSYVPGEGSPGEFYHRYGFVDTGEVDDDELVARLELGV